MKQKKGLFIKNYHVYTHQNGILGLDIPFTQDEWMFRG